jgi:hypothetical protein
LGTVGTLCLVDLTLALVWLATDPMQRVEQHYSLQEPAVGSGGQSQRVEDVMLLPVLELCQCAHQTVWTGKSSTKQQQQPQK